MKALLRKILASFGYALRHVDSDPLIQKLDRIRENLRRCPAQDEMCQHELSQLALSAHLRALLALHRPDLVIDVGANRGQFADELRGLGYSGPIISLEPQSALAGALSERAAATDPAWTVFHGAAGDSPGELTLQIFADDSFSSFHNLNHTAHDRFGELVTPTATERVPVRTLHSWIAATPYAGASRIFIKTDTQGHDLAVLRGAPLHSACMVLAEASMIALYDSAHSPAELAALLEPAGLRSAGFYAVSHDRRDLAVIELDYLFTRAPA